MHNKHFMWLAACGLVLAGGLPAVQATTPKAAPNIPMTAAAPLITSTVDSSQLVAVKGSVLPAANAKYDTGALTSSKQLKGMTLLLKRSPDVQARYESYLTQLTTPHSPYFHKWLTAQQLGDKFGPSKQDIAKVSEWLRSQGMSVGSLSKSGMRLQFSGNVAAVQSAFHTQLHSYTVNGEKHFANASAQQIPAALSQVVAGVVSLNNFFPKPQKKDVGTVKKSSAGHWTKVANAPGFTNPPNDYANGTQYDVAPADFNTIYNVNSLWAGTAIAGSTTPIRGAGQTIAVLERTDVLPADIATFRTAFLPADAAGVVNYASVDDGGGTCVDPGTNPDEGEAALDAEWAGAAAPDANITFAACADSDTDFGPFIAAENLLDSNPPQIMSLSYGGCEVSQGPGEEEVYELWSEAVSEGVTVFVASDDAGAAGCDQNEAAASYGVAVNGLASTPYNTAVGGTDFNDIGKTATYWSNTNAANGGSVLGYVPEQTWNDSCASSVLFTLEGASDGEAFCNTSTGTSYYLDTAGGGGGASSYFYKPSWQVGVYGSPAQNVRMLPDVSLFAANGLYGHALLYCMSDASQGGTTCDYNTTPDDVVFNSAGGTSFASPAMAGIQALMDQATAVALNDAGGGFSLGNVNPAMYLFGTREYGTQGSPNTASVAACNSSTIPLAGNTCVFNNITVGNIDVPCYAGTPSCYSRGLDAYGVLSLGGSVSLVPAYATNAGYSYATGLGSVNAANLANATVNYNKVGLDGGSIEFLPEAPSDFLTSNSTQFPVDGGQLPVYVDGRTDVALVNPTTGILTELGMIGSTVNQTVNESGLLKGYTIAAIGDFNGDGIADFAFTNPNTNELYILINDGYGDTAAYDAGSYPTGWTIVGAARINSGQMQLVWRNNASGQVGWWTFNNFTFTSGVAVGTVTHTVSPLIAAASGYKLTLANVSGGYYADFVWTGPNNDLYIWTNDGGPLGSVFTAHFIENVPAGWTLQGAGDVNGDGQSDLLWTNTSTNQFGWWIMNGTSIVQTQTRALTPGYSIATLGDFNGDGLVDVLFTNAAGNAYLWTSLGNGFQSFMLTDPTGAPVTIPAGAQVAPNRLQGYPTDNGIFPEFVF